MLLALPLKQFQGWHQAADTISVTVTTFKSLMFPTKNDRLPLPEDCSVTQMSVTAVNMSSLKHVCMPVNISECRSATFAQWVILGRSDQRLHRQGECLHMHTYRVQVTDLASRCCFSAILSIHEYVCDKLLESQFVRQSVANTLLLAFPASNFFGARFL